MDRILSRFPPARFREAGGAETVKIAFAYQLKVDNHLYKIGDVLIYC